MSRTLSDYRQLAIENSCIYTPDRIPATTRTSIDGWKCANGHTKSSSYSNFKQKPGCKVCYDNERIKKLEDYHALADGRGIIYLPNTIPQTTRITVLLGWKCKICEYIWSAHYNNIDQSKTSGCPQCGNQIQKTLDDYKTLASMRNFTYLLESIPQSTNDLTLEDCWKCTEGHTWKATYQNLAKKNPTGCQQCYADTHYKTWTDYQNLAIEHKLTYNLTYS
jgi:protein-arginine kinase activator protein McsA